MSDIVNGILTVPSFSPTGNPGEYTISGATFNSQSDTSGSGTGLLAVGFVIYVPASDPATFAPMPGIAHRYKLTNLTTIDQSTIDATVVWDEVGPEIDSPTNGVDCLITQTSNNKKYGFVVDPQMYSTLPSYVISAAQNDDIQNITDIAGSASNAIVLPTDTVAISGHRVIITGPTNAARYASSDDITTANKVIGISTEGANINSTVNVQTTGQLVEPTWNWVNGPVYVGLQGHLTQVVPTVGYILPMGNAINATTINIGKLFPLVLN